MSDDGPFGAGDGDVVLSVVPADLAVHLAALAAATEAIGAYDIPGLDGRAAAALGDAVSLAASRLSIAGARALPVVEADGLWATRGGAATLSRWVANRHGSGLTTATAQVRLGRALRDHLPLTAAAAAAGAISVEHAHVLATLAPTTEARRAALADPDSDSDTNEAWLVQLATENGVDHFRRLVRYWAKEADPDADDRGYVEASDREFLVVSPTTDGMHVKGFLATGSGQAFRQALEAITPVPAAGDDRTSDQRRAQALHDMSRLVLDHGMAGTGKAVRPRIAVLVTHETLVNLTDRAAARQAGDEVPPVAPGLTRDAVLNSPRFEDGTPVPRALLDRLACDSEINRYVFGPHSEILDVGRAERTFTKHLRSAIIARDKHCRYPGCTAPPAISEGHHVNHWSRDHGDTSVANGILLCWHHHDYVHKRNIAIRWTSGEWVFEWNGTRIE